MKTSGMMALAAGTAIGFGSAAFGQVIDWNNAAGGSWHTLANWTPANEPDAMNEFARFAAGGAYTVSLSQGRNIAGVRFVDAATVAINNAAALTVGAEVSGPGTIVINDQGGGSGTYLALVDGAVVSGLGVIRLNATSGVLDRAYLMTSGGGTNRWTHGAGHRILGKGNIYYSFNNDGAVTADAAGEVLQVNSGAVTNGGTFSAVDGGVLRLTGMTVTQTGNGVIHAVSGPVQLISSSVTGGTITSTGLQAVSSVGGVQTLSDVTVAGAFNVDNATQISLVSSLSQTGLLTVNPQGGGSATVVNMNNGVTLRGAGVLALNATSGVLDRAYIQTVGAGANTWTHAAEHTIRGKGNIYYGLTNNGRISASEPGETLQMISGAVVNNGTLESTGGVLQLTSGTVTQSGNGQIAATQGPVRLTNTTVTGGTIAAPAGRTVSSSGGTQTLSNVTVAGAFDVDNATQVVVPTSITQTGVMTVNPQGGGSATILTMQNGATLAGAGTVVLNATSGVLDRAYIQTAAAGGNNWFHGVGHTIRGKGRIYYGFTNNGLVSATEAGETLELISGTVINNAVLRASGGNLRISNAVVEQAGFGGAGGRIEAVGTTVELISTTVNDGQIAAVAGGSVGTGGAVTVNHAAVSGTFNIRNATEVRVPHWIVNSGTMTVNPEGGGSATILRLDGSAVAAEIRGGGRVVLNATSGVLDRAYIVASGQAANGEGHTIGGTGRIYGPLTNRGVIAPSYIEMASGALTQDTTGVLRFNLSSGGSTRLAGPGTKNLGGTLELTFEPGFTPTLCASYTVITGPIVGRFARVEAPTLPLGRLTVLYGANEVTVQYVPADYNGDGFPDFFDYGDFVACFEGIECPVIDGQQVTADFNNDGFVDFFDYGDFVDAFERGC